MLNRVCVVGAGPVGLEMAVRAVREGLDVCLIECSSGIAGNVRVLSAEGRLSAWILGLLPFAIALLLSVINPEFISVLWTDPMGVHMLQISLGLMLIGILWMWRMVHIRI